MNDASDTSPHQAVAEQRRGSFDISKPHPSEFLEFITVPDSGPLCLQSLRTDDVQNLDKDTTRSRANVIRSDDDLFLGISAAIPSLRRFSAEARAATKAEHRMTFMKGLKLYPRALGFSVLLSMTIVMEGFDLTLINSFYAFPVFRRSYGTRQQQGDYQISPAWQSGLTNAAVAGEILGLLFNGVLTDKFGYHRTMVGTLIWMSLFVFLAFFAVNIEMLLAAQVLCGLPWGIFQVWTPHTPITVFRANEWRCRHSQRRMLPRSCQWP